jgi:hypothetical protein
MNSQANGLLKVAHGVLKDYLVAYPHDMKDVARDKERLTLLVKERGIGIFTLDLPALDKTLTSALESGRLTLDGALSKRVSSSVLVPKLFRGLWLRIFDSCGNLNEDIDTTAIFLLRQLLCLGKKLEVECSSARTKAVMEEYYNVEREARVPTLSWGHDDLGSDDTCSLDDLVDRPATCGRDQQLEFWEEPNLHGSESLIRLLRRCQQNFDIFAETIGEFQTEDFSSTVRNLSRGLGFRHGPGAVSDLTSKEYKYDFPTWSEKLGRTFPYDKYGRTQSVGIPPKGVLSTESEPPSEDLLVPEREGEASSSSVHPSLSPGKGFGDGSQRGSSLAQPFSLAVSGDFVLDDSSSFLGNDEHFIAPDDARRPRVHEAPSKLMAVPKTAKGPRLIAAESTSHQWCQQLLLKFLEERLSGLFANNFIALRRQDLSQALVVQASIDKSLATVDLSSASDRLTCWLVERAFRRNPSLLRALHATRTRWVADCVLDAKKPSNYFVMKKFATQGTAVTFPVQSIIFLIIALTASGFDAKHPEDFFCNNRICNSIGRFRNKVRVFGDDIILPSTGYDSLILLLHALGLKVSTDKSFVKGHFRESCGMDAYKGDNVTPIKTKVIRATGPKSRQSLIDYSNNLHKAGLWNAAVAAESILPKWIVNNLPAIGLGFGGVGRFSFTGTKFDHLRKRWNNRLHRDEYRTYRLTTRMRRIPTNTLSGVLQYVAEAPSPYAKWEHGIPGRTKTSDGLGWRALY